MVLPEMNGRLTTEEHWQGFPFAARPQDDGYVPDVLLESAGA